jgi:nucleotide-binding universal stress UspA family protein
MYKTILVATDGSDAANRAVDTAAGFAAKFGAGLHVVHVMLRGKIPQSFLRMAEVEHLIEPSSRQRPSPDKMPAGMAPTLDYTQGAYPTVKVATAYGDQILTRAANRARKAGVDSVTSHFEEGDSAEAILEVAGKVGADLIVLGTRGMGELKGLMLGSVSHKVIQFARCSCVAVK